MPGLKVGSVLKKQSTAFNGRVLEKAYTLFQTVRKAGYGPVLIKIRLSILKFEVVPVAKFLIIFIKSILLISEGNTVIKKPC